MPPTEKRKTLTIEAQKKAADTIGTDLPAIQAVAAVESRGSGFLPDARPVILFERHIMRRRLLAHGIDPSPHIANYPSLVSSKPGGYQGGVKEWQRLIEARKIHPQSAEESCSWGRFQIMGFHWKSLGYDSLDDFVTAMYRSEDDHLDAMVRLVMINPGLRRALCRHDWQEFARLYNGSGYLANRYDAKLAEAYAHHGGAT